MQATVKDITDFYNQHPECIGFIDSDTRFGSKTIQFADITAYDSEVMTITTSTGKTISTSPDHLLFDSSWKKTKEFKIGDLILTKDKFETVTSILLEEEKEDLYDLQIEDVKEFYANGFVSHNSTLLDALTFVLFGKSFRNINKPQLLNTITKRDLLVEIEFSIGKNNYLIRRGMKPNVFEVFCNDSLLNQSAEMRDYQDILEKQILKSNYKTFCQVDILGSASFVPFMQLPAAQRRAVIEDLLDLQVFSNMNVLLKELIQQNNQDIVENSYKKKMVEEKIKFLNDHLEEVRRKSTAFIDDKRTTIDQLAESINKEQKNIALVQESIASLKASISHLDYEALKRKKSKLENLKLDIASKKEGMNREIHFFENHDHCPTCMQLINAELSCEKVSDATAKLQEIDSGLIKLNDLLEEVNDSITICNSAAQAITTYLNTKSCIELSINQINWKISSLNEEIEAAGTSVDASSSDLKIVDLERELNRVITEHSELHEQRTIFSHASFLLKDGGIKTKIINQYLPIINKLINKFLSSMDFFVDFQLNGQFEETIKSRHRDEFSYASFSEGEKQRIDLALLFTWRAVAKLRNSMSTNLLILDEVFDSSLDTNSTEMLMQILNTVSSEFSLFVISHKDHLIERFPNIIRFTKHKNFSRIEGQ